MGQTGWLISNGFLRTKKFQELEHLFLEAAKRQNMTLIPRTNRDIPLLLTGTLGQVNQEMPSWVLFWDKDIRLGQWLEAQGIPLYNSSHAVAVCDDKSLTHLALTKAGLPQPRTVCAPMTYDTVGYDSYAFLEQVEDLLGYPVVVKECFGSFGTGVYLARDRAQLERIVTKIGAKPMLFQEFIRESAGRDLRLQVVGEEVVAAMRRTSQNGDFRANLTIGGQMEAYTPTKEETALAVRAAKAVGASFVGVDLLFGSDGPFVCEMNSNAHFKNLLDCTGVSVADTILAFIRETPRGRH